MSISKLLDSHGFQHETALKHLNLLLQQKLLQEQDLIQLHGLHKSELQLNTHIEHPISQLLFS
jgi:hypothetical protein